MTQNISRVLILKDYQSVIHLQAKSFQRSSTSIDYDAVVRQLFDYFKRSSVSSSHDSILQCRSFIRNVLTRRGAEPDHRYPPRIYDLVDQMLIYERDHMKTLTHAANLPMQFKSFPYLRVWHGDITTLVVDAIVNAGNNALLGCFQPTHVCIDNVIHAAAGPRLRDDCFTIMSKQRCAEPEGGAKITSGYNLPSNYVLHTVGPQLMGQTRISRQNIQDLTSCYRACLNLAAEMGTVQSIAFCCISTGLFAFPADEACRIAIGAVTEWFHEHGSSTKLSLIVFNVFNVDDEQRYMSALAEQPQ